MTSVLQPWVEGLPLKMQAVLISAIRGPDGFRKEDPVKPFVRQLRAAILVPADSKSSFMLQDMGAPWTAFVGDLDPYPLHFVSHFMQACEILGYYGPSFLWHQRYLDIVHALHLNPETDVQLMRRLG
jgi:hypothetical protein